MDCLRQKNCNINHMGKKKANALYYSIMFGTPETTEYLIKLGLDVNVQNYIKRTPLMKAIYLCNEEKTKMLL